MYVYVLSPPRVMVPMWRSENILCESILSFYHMGPGTQTQAVRLGSTCLYLLSHLASPVIYIFKF